MLEMVHDRNRRGQSGWNGHVRVLNMATTNFIITADILRTNIFNNTAFFLCGPGSSVGIATDYGLDGPGN